MLSGQPDGVLFRQAFNRITDLFFAVVGFAFATLSQSQTGNRRIVDVFDFENRFRRALCRILRLFRRIFGFAAGGKQQAAAQHGKRYFQHSALLMVSKCRLKCRLKRGRRRFGRHWVYFNGRMPTASRTLSNNSRASLRAFCAPACKISSICEGLEVNAL